MIQKIQQKSWFITLMMVFVSCLISCNEKEKSTSFSLTQKQVTLTANEVMNIKINSGSGNFTLINDNEAVVKASLTGNNLRLEALSQGNAHLTIKDNETLLQDILTVFVSETPTAIPEGVVIENHILKEWPAKSIPVNGKVVLPEGIEGIGVEAFTKSPIEEIVFPHSLKFIAEGAFSYCNALKTLTLPEGLDSLGDGAFYQCHQLQRVVVPKTLSRIAPNAFAQCTSLKDVVLQEGLSLLGESMFQGCTSLTHITLPKSIKTLKDNVFNECTLLEEI